MNGTPIKQDANEPVSLSIAIGFGIFAKVQDDAERDVSNSQGSQARRVLDRSRAHFQSMWTHRGCSPAGPFPNAYNYRRRHLLDGLVCCRELPDADYHMSARERDRANSDSHAAEGKQQVDNDF